ncbi:hypothetical protein C1H76_1602 [Elsinoe australis]|uniref:Uncharacterized protein n=1 Tax=Elsinoe australis TaxID=40998 RepID=A0A4U7B5L8_9PEZI|nr:hypothetical protein C1H76_1602 [Elsinoe australis]
MGSFRRFRGGHEELHAYSQRKTDPTSPPNHYYLTDKSLGGISFGKAKIDICLRRQLTKWGTRSAEPGAEKQHCGLLVIQLTSAQDPKFKLKYLTGDIDFSSGVELGDIKPGGMSGYPYEKRVTKGIEFSPQIEAPGTTVAVGSINKSSESTKTYQWLFTAKKLTNPSDKDKIYNRLSWTLEDQKEGSSSIFDRPITLYVELYFTTNVPQAFKVTVNVDGKLKSRRAEFKRKWFCFAPAEPCVGQMVEPKFTNPPRPVDHLTATIIAQVRQANKDAIPEIVDVQQAAPSS